MSDLQYSPLSGVFRPDHTALIPYLTAGYPSLEGADEVADAYVQAGADIVEIGVPFSDPLADGPTIQDTTTRALRSGANLDYCLQLASRHSGRAPVALLIYYNNIHARGSERFLGEAAEAGVSALVIPDLPMDNAGEFRELADEKGISVCSFIAPTSTAERMGRIGAIASGFVYCVSVAGVTGARDELPPGALDLLRRAKEHVSVPVALGFGIGSPEAAAEAAAEADGIIIGSKLMQLVGESGAEGAGYWLSGVRSALDAAKSG